MLIWKSQRTVIFVCVILIIGRKLVIFIIYRLLMLKTKILNLSNPSHNMVTMDGKTYHKNDIIKHTSVVTDFIIRPEDDSGSTVILQTYILNSYVGGM